MSHLQRKWPHVVRAASKLADMRPGRAISAGPFVPESHPERANVTLSATVDIPNNSCIGFVPTPAVFSARHVYKGANNPLVEHLRNALVGYEPLRQAKPSLFQQLELSSLLWIERRGTGLGFSGPWTEWTHTLPDCAYGTAPFLAGSVVDKMFSATSLEDLGAEDLKETRKKLERVNRVLDVFSDSIGMDLLDALQIVEQEAGDSLWGRGDPKRQELPFSELFREEFSLVLSRAVAIPPSEEELALGRNWSEIVIVPGLDQLFFSPSAGNVELLIVPRPDTPEGQKALLKWTGKAGATAEFGQTGGVVARTTRSIGAGEELILALDQLDGFHLLANQGIVELDAKRPWFDQTTESSHVQVQPWSFDVEDNRAALEL